MRAWLLRNQATQKLREEQELRRLREEVEAAEKDLHRPVSRGDEPKPVKGKIFSLDNLRQDAKLRSRAQKELSKLGLFACDSSDEDSDEESKLSNAERVKIGKLKSQEFLQRLLISFLVPKCTLILI